MGAMDARTRHDRAHELLARARAARSDRNSAAQIDLLDQAVQTLSRTEDRELLVRVCWRLAKAAHDLAEPQALARAMDHLLSVPGAFAHPSAVRALPALCQKWWDLEGYHDERPGRLWLGFIEHYQAQGDPWLSACGRTQRAWHLACSGKLDELDELVNAVLALDPHRFGDGPSRHPQAPDTPTSVWWAHLAVLQPALWSAAWSHRPRRAAYLLDALLDASDAAQMPVASSAWLIDAAARAAYANDLTESIARYTGPWRQRLNDLDHPRADFHRAMADGLLASHQSSESATPAFLSAADIAAKRAIGPEWQVDALLHAARAGQRFGPHDGADDAARRARSLVDTFGLAGLLPGTSADDG